MVVARSVLNLVELGVDRVTDSVRSAEVHSCTLYRLDFASGNVQFVARSEVVGIHVKYLVISCLCKVAAQIVVVVVCLVDDCRLVSLCFPCHVQCIAIHYLVGCDGSHLAWESVLTIFSDDGQFQDRVANLLCVVNLIHPTGSTSTVQAVRSVVLLQLIGCVTQFEGTVLDAVGLAAYAGTIVRGRVQCVGILSYVVEPQHHVSKDVVTIGYDK